MPRSLGPKNPGVLGGEEGPVPVVCFLAEAWAERAPCAPRLSFDTGGGSSECGPCSTILPRVPAECPLQGTKASQGPAASPGTCCWPRVHLTDGWTDRRTCAAARGLRTGLATLELCWRKRTGGLSRGEPVQPAWKPAGLRLLKEADRGCAAAPSAASGLGPPVQGALGVLERAQRGGAAGHGAPLLPGEAARAGAGEEEAPGDPIHTHPYPWGG